MRHALDYFAKHFVAADATVASVVDLEGKISDPTFDLYNQAFALLAYYASGHGALGEEAGWRRQAVALRSALEQSYADPHGGFAEDRGGRLPRRANPHMHLLESALAWVALDDEDRAWRRMADAVATLCIEKFIDPASGALREFFAADWSPALGVEANLRAGPPLRMGVSARPLGAAYRSRPAGRGVTVDRVRRSPQARCPARRGDQCVLADGRIHDATARLWAQTERIRAYVAQGRTDAEITAAIGGLQRFLATPTRGVWFDQLTADDSFVCEPARATSLYHIIGAVAELSAAVPDAAKANSPASRPLAPAPRHLPRDGGLVFHLPSPADGARRPQGGLRGPCRDPRRPPSRRDRGGRFTSPSHLLASRHLDPRDLVRVVRECAGSTAASSPISPITLPCRRPSSDRLPPSAFPSFASTR